MKKIYLYILLLTLLVTSCKTNAVPEEEDLVISLRKTACFGSCPVYKLEIYDKGTVIYEGEKDVELKGKYRSEVSQKELENLIGEFEEKNFFQFEDEYTEHVTDLPTTYIYFQHNGKSKKIKDYYGAPEELKKLEKLVADLVDNLNWEKVD